MSSLWRLKDLHKTNLGGVIRRKKEWHLNLNKTCDWFMSLSFSWRSLLSRRPNETDRRKQLGVSVSHDYSSEIAFQSYFRDLTNTLCCCCSRDAHSVTLVRILPALWNSAFLWCLSFTYEYICFCLCDNLSPDRLYQYSSVDTDKLSVIILSFEYLTRKIFETNIPSK